MSKFDESRARRCEAYHWIDSGTAKHLAGAIVGQEHDFHLRVFEGLTEHGQPETFLQLWSGRQPSAESEPCSPLYNASHVCPPDCP